MVIIIMIMFMSTVLVCSALVPSIILFHKKINNRNPMLRLSSSEDGDDNKYFHNDDQPIDDHHLFRYDCTRRRRLLQTILGGGGIIVLPMLETKIAHAGEIGERINRAVTESDLGIQVRREVVRGAQIMDQWDEQWEKWSDRLQLGEARSKQPKAPIATKKSTTEKRRYPLNSNVAQQCLTICDQVFLNQLAADSSNNNNNNNNNNNQQQQQQQSILSMMKKELQQSVQKISKLVQPSFERSGLMIPTNDVEISTGEQLNFWSYVHFRAYADLLLTSSSRTRPVNFANFKKRFEIDVGKQLLNLFYPDVMVARTLVNNLTTTTTTTTSSTSSRRSNILESLARVDLILSRLVETGFVSSTDRSAVNSDQLDDWIDGLSDLSFSIALDGDVTIGTQTLLQEQGYRLYPNYGRWAIAAILYQSGEKIQIDDYYFDTEYNPDPNQYEVKQVLINVVIQSS